jgi:FMN phosphatase YigB (HAD superfamily)
MTSRVFKTTSGQAATVDNEAQQSLHTIFLDWDGTLSVSRFWAHWAHIRPSDFEAIQAVWRDQPDLITSWMRGGLTAETYVDRLAAASGLSSAELLEGLSVSCQAMEFIDGSVLELLSRLRQTGVRVVIATDNMDAFRRWTVPALGLQNQFDDILDSYSLGALKKDQDPSGRSRFFGTYLDQHQLHPRQALLVDDSASNHVVEQFGISYVKIDRGASLAPILIDLFASESPVPPSRTA